MAYLMLVILVLEFMATALNQVGYSEVATALWKWYSGFAKNDRLYKKDQLRAAIVQLRQDISQVSSVDEFAKWAKMRRRLDALTEAYDQISGDITIERTGFVLRANLVIRVVLYGLRALLGYWYFSTPVFYLPVGWLYPFEWFLSLPGAPSGSVSVVAWMFVCRRVCEQAVTTYSRIYRPVPAIHHQ